MGNPIPLNLLMDLGQAAVQVRRRAATRRREGSRPRNRDQTGRGVPTGRRNSSQTPSSTGVVGIGAPPTDTSGAEVPAVARGKGLVLGGGKAR